MEGGDSHRIAEDGYTYFGSQEREEEDSPPKNDIVIPAKNEASQEQFPGRHFQIRFDVAVNGYRIKDLGVGYGVFAKIDEPVELKDNNLINMGETFMVITLLPSS